MDRKCQEVEPWLDGLFDGELTADERQMAEAHVSQCADCRHKLAEIEALSSQLAALPKLAVGRDLSAEILKKAQAKPATKNNVVIFKRKEVWAAAAACLLLGLTLPFWHHEPVMVSQVPPVKSEAPLVAKLDTDKVVAAVHDNQKKHDNQIKKAAIKDTIADSKKLVEKKYPD
ncbi:MAG: zf-HC2 domain-containing protein, partial [Candidatus Obscuribacterales bacterium]|nr:zf-HC2 domain-containing protein [Candidatus Obscuribacterales bacterium]